jgi:hypothetical protein
MGTVKMGEVSLGSLPSVVYLTTASEGIVTVLIVTDMGFAYRLGMGSNIGLVIST